MILHTFQELVSKRQNVWQLYSSEGWRCHSETCSQQITHHVRLLLLQLNQGHCLRSTVTQHCLRCVTATSRLLIGYESKTALLIPLRHTSSFWVLAFREPNKSYVKTDKQMNLFQRGKKLVTKKIFEFRN